MSDNLDKYLPEYDENEARKKLAGFSTADLTDMLIRAYKEKRVLAKSRPIGWQLVIPEVW